MKVLLALCLCLLCAFTAEAKEAKKKSKPSPNFIWQETEWIASEGKPDSYRMGFMEVPDGGLYTIHRDGTANITIKNGSWDILCKKDPIDDERKCFIGNHDLRLVVYFGSSKKPEYIKLLKHKFPGKNGTLRIDKGQAITSDMDGVIDGKYAELLADAKTVTTRIYIWPYDRTDDKVSTRTSGYPLAVSLLTHIQAHIDEMSFK